MSCHVMSILMHVVHVPSVIILHNAMTVSGWSMYAGTTITRKKHIIYKYIYIYICTKYKVDDK